MYPNPPFLFTEPPFLNGNAKPILGVILPLESTDAPTLIGVPTAEPGKINFRGSTVVFNPNDAPCS